MSLLLLAACYRLVRRGRWPSIIGPGQKKRQILGTDDGRRQIALRSAAKGRGGNKVMKKWPEQPKLILGRGPIVLFFALVLSALPLRNEMDGAATTPMDQSTWRRPVCHPDSVPPSIKGRQEQEEHKQ